MRNGSEAASVRAHYTPQTVLVAYRLSEFPIRKQESKESIGKTTYVHLAYGVMLYSGKC